MSARKIDRLDRAEEQPFLVKPLAVPILLERGSRRQVSEGIGSKEGSLDRRYALSRLADRSEVLHPHLVVGQLILVIDDREEVLFAHVDRSEHILAQVVEVDEVSFGENPDQVLGSSSPGFMAATEDAEIMRSGLDHVAPLTDITVDEVAPDEVRLACKEGEQGIVAEILHLDLATFHEVESLLRGEAEAGALHPAISPLLVERAPLFAEAHPGSVECRQHVIEL